MNSAEIKSGWFLNILHHFRILLRIQSGELHLDTIVPHRTDHRFGDTERIHPVTDNLDRLIELLTTLILAIHLRGTFVHFQCDRDTTTQIETVLQRAL